MEASLPLLCKKYVTVVSRPFGFVMHCRDTHGTVYTRNTSLNAVLAFEDRLRVPAKLK